MPLDEAISLDRGGQAVTESDVFPKGRLRVNRRGKESE